MPARKPLNFSPNETGAILDAADATPLNDKLVALMSCDPDQDKKLKLYDQFTNLRTEYLDLKAGTLSREAFDAKRKDFTEKYAALSDSGMHAAKELVKETLAAMDKQIKQIVGRDYP